MNEIPMTSICFCIWCELVF